MLPVWKDDVAVEEGRVTPTEGELDAVEGTCYCRGRRSPIDQSLVGTPATIACNLILTERVSPVSTSMSQP